MRRRVLVVLFQGGVAALHLGGGEFPLAFQLRQPGFGLPPGGYQLFAACRGLGFETRAFLLDPFEFGAYALVHGRETFLAGLEALLRGGA